MTRDLFHIEPRRKLVPLGFIVHTPGAAAAVPIRRYCEALSAYSRGDWGRVDADGAAANDRSVEAGGKILAAYPIDPRQPCNGADANTFWIITDPGHAVTTILLPEEA